MYSQNSATIAYPLFNNGAPKKLYFPFTVEEAQLQFKEIFVTELYKKARIKKDMVIVDVGASIGLTSLYLRPYAKKIYAIEPCKEVYEALVENTKEDDIKCFDFGIGGLTREAILYGYYDSPASSIRKLDDITSEEKIHLITLKDFMEQEDIEHIDLLKIDCEGAEYEIFALLGNVADKIDYIIGEAHYQPPYVPGYIPLMLKEYGFETEFLPFDNIYQDLDMHIINGEEKSYRLYMQTMFWAYRLTKTK